MRNNKHSDMETITFSYREESRAINMVVPNSSTATDLLDDFKSFLLAIGFCNETIDEAIACDADLTKRAKPSLTSVDTLTL